MPQDKIKDAFRSSIYRNPKGYMYLRTGDFVRALQEIRVHFSGREANQWIERYQTYFVDKTTDESENKLWMLRNMGMVLYLMGRPSEVRVIHSLSFDDLPEGNRPRMTPRKAAKTLSVTAVVMAIRTLSEKICIPISENHP